MDTAMKDWCRPAASGTTTEHFRPREVTQPLGVSLTRYRAGDVSRGCGHCAYHRMRQQSPSDATTAWSASRGASLGDEPGASRDGWLSKTSLMFRGTSRFLRVPPSQCAMMTK